MFYYRNVLNSLLFMILLLLFNVDVSKTTAPTAADNTNFVNNEDTLRSDILSNYNPKIRPNFTSDLYIEFVLLALNDLNIEDQEMSLMAVIHTIWYDGRLTWNASDYGDLTGFTVRSSDVWTPPLLVQNSAAQSIKLLGDETFPYRVFNDGRVLWAPTVRIDTSCEMQVFYFPFEEQECSIVIFAYGYLSHEVSLNVRTEDTPVLILYYGENAAWEFISSSTSKTILQDGDDVYPALKYILKFKRRWLFMAISLILPAFLNLILMLGVFTLHIESGEKMGYSLTVLLSYIVLMTLVGDMLPQVSTSISLLQIYLACVLMVGCFSTLMTIWIINIYNRSDEKEPMPASTRTLLKWVVLPVVWASFWRYLKERFVKRRNRVIDDDTSVRTTDDDARGILDTGGTRSTPPFSTQSPCSLQRVNLEEDKNAIRKLRQILNASKDSTSPNSDRVQTQSEPDASTRTMTDFMASEREREFTLYSESCSVLPPPPISPANLDSFKHDIDYRLDQLTWAQMALMMDDFCLRVLGGILLLVTICVFTILFSNY